MAKLNFLIDSQFLDSIQLCEQKFFYDFVMNLQRAEPNRKILMGSFIHDLLKVYHLTLKSGASHDIAKTAAKDKFSTILSESQIDPVDAEIVLDTFVKNIDFWVHVPIEVVSVEQPEVKLLYEDDSIRVAYVSKIDLKINGPNYENMPVDHKSEHSRNDPSPMANQFIGYAWSTGSPRIIINKVGFQKTLPPKDKFRRYPFYYTDQQKDEWKADTMLAVGRMIEVLPVEKGGKGRRPERNRTSCDKWGGCKYQAVCSVSPENRDFLIKQLFIETEPWSPLKGDGE